MPAKVENIFSSQYFLRIMPGFVVGCSLRWRQKAFLDLLEMTQNMLG